MMIDIIQHIKDHFSESIQTKVNTVDQLSELIAQASRLMSNCLSGGCKILSCGNGGSACDAQHFASEIINRLEKERSSLPAIALTLDTAALTSISNDYAFDQIFERPILALGQPQDVLLAISTSGNSPNVLKAIEAAHTRNMNVIALTGKDGGKLPPLLEKGDLEIRIPSNRTMRIQEAHELIIHCVCDLIEQQLFGDLIE